MKNGMAELLHSLVHSNLKVGFTEFISEESDSEFKKGEGCFRKHCVVAHDKWKDDKSER